MQINNEMAAIIINMTKKHGVIELRARGTSMFPFIQQDDMCTFTPCQASTLNNGDIVLYHSSTGRFIAHRLIKAIWTEDGRFYICRGDTNHGLDEPVSQTQIIGKLTSIHRNNKTIRMTDRLSRLWGALVLSFPVLSRILNKFASVKRKSQAMDGVTL